MSKLIVNPDTEHGWEIPLPEGTHSLGRDATLNTVPIDHPSLAPAHCQITAADGRVYFHSLDPAHVSLLNGEPVEKIVLNHGQELRLGDVQMRFESPGASAAASSPHIASQASRAPGSAAEPISMCRYHPQSPAGNFCGHCQKSYCSLCVSQRGGQNYCRACGNLCTALDITAALLPAEEVSFYRQIPEVFTYPFRGNGLWMILIGSVLYAILDFASRFSLFVWVLMLGYAILYAQGIIHATAQGDDRGPQWPDTQGDFRGSLIGASFQYLMAWILCLLPAFLVFYLGSKESLWTIVAGFGLAGIGLLYLPMALLAVAMFDTVGAVNPMVVVPAIAKVPLAYTVVLVIFGLVATVSWLIHYGFESFISLPFLPDTLSSLFSMYFLTVTMRLLGILYRSHRHELGWF